MGRVEKRRLPRLRTTRSDVSARDAIEEKYGNLFQMYELHHGRESLRSHRCASTRPLTTLWAGSGSTKNLMSNVDGLFVIGEANFSDHGANRLGASALMQGLADGYFIVPYTLASYLAPQSRGDREREWSGVPEDRESSIRTPRRFSCKRAASARWTRSIASSAKSCAMSAGCHGARHRSSARSRKFAALREEFHANLNLAGNGEGFEHVARARGPRR